LNDGLITGFQRDFAINRAVVLCRAKYKENPYLPDFRLAGTIIAAGELNINQTGVY
jgi:hypothetical protein